MDIYSYKEIKNIIEQGKGVLLNGLPINLEKYDEDSLFFRVGSVDNPMNNPYSSIKVEKIDTQKMNVLYEYLTEIKSAKLSDLYMHDYYDSQIYGLKYKGLVSIENETIKLK